MNQTGGAEMYIEQEYSHFGWPDHPSVFLTDLGTITDYAARKAFAGGTKSSAFPLV